MLSHPLAHFTLAVRPRDTHSHHRWADCHAGDAKCFALSHQPVTRPDLSIFDLSHDQKRPCSDVRMLLVSDKTRLIDLTKATKDKSAQIDTDPFLEEKVPFI